ncbi:MAG: hypothetical protein ACREKG_06285 [Candidatus Rokuibacteriota bacterium]
MTPETYTLRQFVVDLDRITARESAPESTAVRYLRLTPQPSN